MNSIEFDWITLALALQNASQNNCYLDDSICDVFPGIYKHLVDGVVVKTQYFPFSILVMFTSIRECEEEHFCL